jgi:hypothetical protein
VLPPGKWPAVAEVPICCRGPLPATLAAALSKHKLEASWESIDNLPYAAQQEMLEPIEHEVFAGYDGPLTDSTLYYMVKVGHDAGILTREELGGCAPMPRVLIGGAPEAAAIIRGNQHSNRKGRAKVLQHVAKMRFRHQVGLEVDAMRDEALDRLGGIHGQAGFALREFAAYIKSM